MPPESPSQSSGPVLAGSDAERRRAVALRESLARGGWDTELETFWGRPNRALAQALNLCPALAGSLLAGSAHRAAAALVILSVLAALADELFWVSPGRWLTRHSASQNLVAWPPLPPGAEEPGAEDPLIEVLATVDTPRTGVIDRLPVSAPPSLLLVVLLALFAVVLARTPTSAVALKAAQFGLTAVVLIAIAALLDRGVSRPASDLPAQRADLAIQLTAELAAAGLPGLDVRLSLLGASAEDGTGLRRHTARYSLPEARRGRPVVTLVLTGPPDRGGAVRPATRRGLHPVVVRSVPDPGPEEFDQLVDAALARAAALTNGSRTARPA